MSSPFLGEIRMFAGPYAPAGWAMCWGQMLDISSYQALYSLIGVTYGGDGKATFALPDLRGRVPMGSGQGQGLTARTVGQAGGVSGVTLTEAQMPAHSHTFSVSNSAGATMTASEGSGLAQPPQPASGATVHYAPSSLVTTPTTFAAKAISVAAGSNGMHSNVMPSIGINFIMALVGLYPNRPNS